jgi:dihydroxyacetone kinase-like predicted kinase
MGGGRRGRAPPVVDHHAPARVTHPQHASTTFRYCTNFAVTGRALEQRRFVRALEALGDSVLVVGDQTTLKVHVHTDDPDAATALFDDAGVISHLDVADMRAQVRERDERLARNDRRALCGALAVISGDGMGALFESFGVRTLDGGPKLNPSTYELLAAIHASSAEEVVVLANSPNVVMAAERAAALSDKKVRVVPSRSPQAGLAAAVSLDPGRGADENVVGMIEALERVRTGAVAPAARDDARGRFREGDAVGFVDDEIVVWGRPREALRGVLERLASGAELITCLRGAEAPLDDETVQTLAHGEVEFELSDGGQKSYWWLLSAE